MEAVKKLCVRVWRNEHGSRAVKFLATGGSVTLVGFLLLTFLVEVAGWNENLANVAQSLVVFTISFPIYWKVVYRGGSAGGGTAFARWFVVKLLEAVIVVPLVFYVASLCGSPYPLSFVLATGTSAVISFLAGYLAFGHSFALQKDNDETPGR